MYMIRFNKKIFALFLIVSLFAPVLFSVAIISFDLSKDGKLLHHNNNSTNLNLDLCQSENYSISIETDTPKFVWIEVFLTIEVVSNVSGQIKCTFIDKDGGKTFKMVRAHKELNDNEVPIHLKLTSRPNLSTLPGKYVFVILVSYIPEGGDESDSVQIYDDVFKVVLGMGYLFLFLILIVFGTAILVVLAKKEVVEPKKKPTSTSSTRIPEGKVKCPDCEKLIDEGLAFCPECGSRIPDFLRFSSKPSSSIV